MGKRLNSPEAYAIAWIAALSIERAAATALLDERHDAPQDFEQHPTDANSYTWGQMSNHNIVIGSLPAGSYGETPAATTALNLLASLPHIRIGLLVGIGGGVAQPPYQDIRLGDVVVSQPDRTMGGVIQYDLGKAKPDQIWERKGSLNTPPTVLLHAVAALQAEHLITASKVPDLLQTMWQQYASATAAAYGKELLGFIVPRQLQATRKVIDALRLIEKDLETIQSNTSKMKEKIRTIDSVTSHVDQKLVLDRLAIAEGASFKSQTDKNFTCLANTRVELLEQILQWVHDPNAKPICWLNGMAGTGKSTISRTIASSLNQSRYLGASFFFKRGEADRGNVSRLMTTIVHQLADKEPRLAPMLKDAIEADSTILSSAIQEQFQKLIYEPLFQSIRNDYNLTVGEERKLPPDWPGNSEIKALANITTPLFISAVTACRFIGDRQFHPERSLKDILEHQGKSANSGYGATYLPVLHRQIDGLSQNRKDEVIRQFRYIVGTIIALANPLSASALAQMLNVPQDTIHAQLDMLHSVLYVPHSSNSPIRLLHLSFRDFLVDPMTRDETPLWVDEKRMHRDIAINCLRVMKARLRMDICNMRNPGIARSAISRQSIADHIPQELERSESNRAGIRGP
ncbi:hypothetical protein S40288_10138 [Stachybotrys chartarum IBT 40288]|nr:hypothetical protein S40288_10138 [Stachybotrys chartarum IBT 40288]